jgi:hypothetical protein
MDLLLPEASRLPLSDTFVPEACGHGAQQYRLGTVDLQIADPSQTPPQQGVAAQATEPAHAALPHGQLVGGHFPRLTHDAAVEA